MNIVMDKCENKHDTQKPYEVNSDKKIKITQRRSEAKSRELI